MAGLTTGAGARAMSVASVRGSASARTQAQKQAALQDKLRRQALNRAPQRTSPSSPYLG